MNHNTTCVHVTHEAAEKIGGIGSVLHGFFTSKSYLNTVDRSIVIGPLFTREGHVCTRLGENGKVLYSSIDAVHDSKYVSAFQMIEGFFNTPIVYGTKVYRDAESGIESMQEVILIDVTCMNAAPINDLKAKMFQHFDIRSNLYEYIWEFEQYVRLAPVAMAILREIGAASDHTNIIAHEFMGMPTALAAKLDNSCHYITTFYAHEVATVREIVEKSEGRDTMFYNSLNYARQNGLFVDQVFGDRSYYFKHPLVKASRFCDHICAVGDYVAEELQFLSPDFAESNINIVYNGIGSYKITTEDKLRSKAKLQAYCKELLKYEPDFIFTHVSRLVPSKGLWRDLQILERIEKEFRIQGHTGVMLLLATETGAKRPCEIQRIEKKYNWPVVHREGWPDLSGGEASLYEKIQEFNAVSRNLKVIFINQFGFSRKSCGNRVPEDINFLDIRKGADVEFGLSIYEPFGIAQLEALTFGGICVISSVCGCAGLLRDVTKSQPIKNVIVADYISLNGHFKDKGPWEIDHNITEQVEADLAEKLALQICNALPKSKEDLQDLMRTGQETSKNMTWDSIVDRYLLPILTTHSDELHEKYLLSAEAKN